MTAIEGYQMIIFYKEDKLPPFIYPEIIHPSMIFQKLEVYGTSRLVDKIELRRIQ